MKQDIRFKNVIFTHGDVKHIAKNAFRSWKDAYKIATDDKAKERARIEKKKATRVQRKRQVRINHMAPGEYSSYSSLTIFQKKIDRREMEDTYFNHYGCSITDILETDWMSDYVSELDTSDNEARTFHRGQMVRAARLLGKGEGEVIFERVRPEFRSDEVTSFQFKAKKRGTYLSFSTTWPSCKSTN